MIIKELSIENYDEYQNVNQICGTVFTSIEWLKNFFPNIKIFGIYSKSNKLIGGFAVYVEKKFIFKLVKNPPLTPYPLLFVKNEAKKISSFQTYNKQIMRVISSFLRNKFPKDIIYLSFHHQFFDLQPFIWNGYKVTPRYTYILNLSEDIESLRKQMSSERRNDISKAIRDGLQSKSIDNLKGKEVALALIEDTFRRQGKKIDLSVIKRVIFNFLSEENSFGFITYDSQGTPLSVSICIYDRETAYYILGGYNSKRKHHGAGALSLWHCILEAKRRNLKFFDFEGSMVPNIERFFRGFGGKITPYFTVVKAPYMVECIAKFFKRSVF